MASRGRIIEVPAGLLALVSLGAGLWAMVDPHGFYANAATYPPYSRHFIHDIGAFQIGLGSCLVAGLLVRATRPTCVPGRRCTTRCWPSLPATRSAQSRISSGTSSIARSAVTPATP